MLNGMLLLWLILTALSLIYLTYDLMTSNPDAPVMKIGWWLVVLYTGPVGLFFYLLSCKEPLKGTHEAFTAPLWKQSLGSMVHCLAGDVTGIIFAALFLAFFTLAMPLEILLEYLAGFAFGFLIFQSLFMKNLMGGTYKNALKMSFYPELVSMNMIMAGMIPVMVIWSLYDPEAKNPASLHFWGKMSLATILAGLVAFRMNRWLVQSGLKHGMMTIRKDSPAKHAGMQMQHREPSKSQMQSKFLTSLIWLLVGIAISSLAYYIRNGFYSL